MTGVQTCALPIYLDAYTAVLQAPEVRASLHLPDDIGREQAWQQMAMWLGQWELRGTGQWALEEKSSGAFVGRAGLHCPERIDWPGVEVGWALHPQHWGKGYATEAVRAMIDHVFSDTDAEAIQSAARVTNPPSRRVLEKCGFQWSGAGLLRIRAIASSAPIDRFRLDRGLWASIKAWGQTRRVQA